MTFLKFIPSLKVGDMISSVFVAAPIMILMGIFTQTGIQPPASISGQAWLVSVVAAAMGLTRIVMWVRGGDKKDKDKDRDAEKKEFYKILENHSAILEKIADIQPRVIESQKQLADNQSKSLDLYSKVSENMAVFKVQLENLNDMIMNGINELKAILREKNETS